MYTLYLYMCVCVFVYTLYLPWTLHPIRSSRLTINPGIYVSEISPSNQ